MDIANLKQKQNFDEQRKDQLSFFVHWLSKLAAAYRQEITAPTQAMYLGELADLPLDRLDAAFRRAIRECKFFPSIAEIRQFEREITPDAQRIQEAHERLRQRLAAQPAVRMLPSVLDDEVPARPKPQPLSVAQLEERMALLLKQAQKLGESR